MAWLILAYMVEWKRTKVWAGKVALWVKALVARLSFGPEFESQDSHSRREPVLESCPLTSTYGTMVDVYPRAPPPINACNFK